MNGQHRKDIKPGLTVDIVLKADQKTGKRTRGIVATILTNSSFHPHGIKVRLKDGKVGRVQEIISPSGNQESDKGDGPN
ncbi:putative repeat protein (TIGR03833 family) [Methanofollis sp. W23]|uniref:YwbE family protein n=1 Tax=Methanofollis sp. W23 TaxID=2817849 RepID=UPI001AE54C7D|nr:YwbE family protein [Methanofollis sp. W23]MBP2146523.1 putative repeat protein (TIGR03833 family) [Methanofollis sp. W23]